MPIIKFDIHIPPPLRDWRQAFLEQLRSGKVLPIISNRLHDDLLLGGHKQLVEEYAEYYRVPNKSRCDIPAAAQYKTVMLEIAGAGDIVRREYLDFVKSLLVARAKLDDQDGSLTSLPCEGYSVPG